MIKLKLNNREYNFKLNYYLASVVLPKELKIDILKALTEDGNETLYSLCIDDEKSLKLFHYCIQEESGLSWEEFLELVDGKTLGQFREDFWAEVVNFSDPLKKNLLIELWTQYRKEVRKAAQQIDNSEASS